MKCSVLLCGLLLMQAVGLSAKEQVRLSADDVKMVRSEDSVRVSFRLNVGGLGRDYVLKVTPLLRGKGGQEACLPKLNYGSRRAQIVEWREGGMKKTQAVAPAYNKAGEELLYTHTLPYNDWMEGASLHLEAQSEGCCSKETLQSLRLLDNAMLATPAELFVPVVPRSEPVIPVVEQLAQENKFLGVWTGSVGTKEDIDRYKDEATLVVYFPVGSVRVVPEFENNRANLEHLLSVLDKIAEDKNSRIAKILVVGSASPDGSAELNARIAANRAQVLVDYITSRTRLSPSYFEVKNDQESWRFLRRLVADSDMDSRQQVLHIIDTAPVWDAKKKVGRLGLLMKLNGGKPYHYMKQHFFPKLRNAGYIKVFYEAQPDPELLSLNKAIDLLQAEQYAQALHTLQGNIHFRADNLRGVCHMMNGDTEKARTLFQKAVAAGDPQAAENLKQLEELLNRSR